MIDNQGKRLTALRNRVPNIVLLLLFGLAAIAVRFTGYASGLDAHESTADDRNGSQYRCFL